jgi:diguanylate cyclase (GGDEF)-like protein
MQTALAVLNDLSYPPLVDAHPRPEPLPAVEPRAAALAGLRVEYVQSAGAVLARLRGQLDRLAADAADGEALAELLRGFHSYAGSGATYGFPRVTQLGRAGEAACAALAASRAVPAASRLAALRGLLDSLDAWFAAAAAIAVPGAPAAAPATLQPPPPPAPAAASAPRTAGDTAAGAVGSRIMVVEDDPAQASYVRVTLETAGYQVQICGDPGRFAGDLAAFDPELVLMDVILPGATGYELVRSLRQAPGAAALPVLFLTAEGEMHARLESAWAGGDDHLVKPLPPAALLAAVSGRLERHRRARQLVARDPVTQALSESELLERARAAVSGQQRDPGGRACWVAIELDHLWSIHECYGDTTGNRVLAAVAALLRRHLHPGDSLGRYDSARLAVLVGRLRPRQVAGLIDDLRQQFAGTAHQTPAGGQFRTTFSAGVGVLNPGMSAEQWRAAADRALRVARAAGRNRVELIRRG